MPRLLLIEDDAIMGESLVQRFELEGFLLRWCQRLAEAAPMLQREPFDVVVSDVRLPDGLASRWYVGLPDAQRALPWFFLTGYGSIDDAVAAVRAGAREYLAKPFDIEQLVAMVRGACGRAETAVDDAVLGVSPAMRKVEALVRKVAPQKASVLLTGESGVGKEVAAQLLHALGGRGEFIAVNCAAIPETLLEAEFFGYEKGAFSGAQRQHRGYLERADGGTLFLDEVGDLPPSMQAKLLRALQERSFFRLGAEKPTHSDFRLVSATNRNLMQDMAEGRFREDLFYRLAVIRIPLPPLRERPEDIRWLSQRMLLDMTAEQGRPLAISDSYLRALMGQAWRGNARELRAHLEQAVVMSEAGILDVPEAAETVAGRVDAHGSDGSTLLPLQRMVEDAERQHIQRALAQTEGSIGRSAELLGISRKTLWEKMKRLGLST
ncbi:MAG: sigma-54 dependent transcriptional regulator [Rubrivivax sp.]|nr:sigma-54 dependent transcriptional regulator [Rubrivivax sp.]